MKVISFAKCLLAVVALGSIFSGVRAQIIGNRPLQTPWYVQSSAVVGNDGARISSPNNHVNLRQWYVTTVPHTVLATLVDDGVYRHIFWGRNLAKIPDSLFQVPWWYRTSFQVPALSPQQAVQLIFEGINYRANIWLNGQLIASADTLKGSFRTWTFDVRASVRPGKNILAVQVFPPGAGDLAIGFVDWNPEPPDHNMGIWRPVWLKITGPIRLSQPFVSSWIDTVSWDEAQLTASVQVTNTSHEPQQARIQLSIFPFNFTGGKPIHLVKTISLAPYQSQELEFTPEAFPALRIKHPHLWWTHDWGKPNLYLLKCKAEAGTSYWSDSVQIRFGIRSVTDYITVQGFRGYRLNGKPILIKGGGWTDPMLLNADSDYERAEIDYAVHLGLNAIRMEGFWGHDQHIYDLCDEKGILIMAGFSCQWEWKNLMHSPDDQYSAIITPEQNQIAAASWRDQVLWLRHHPSIFLWLYGSDKWPRPSLEQQYLDILHRFDTTRPYVQSAAEHTSVLTGPSCMKMRGPYDYVPPDYWYVDSTHGGAFGFNTETSPGPEIPMLSSLKKMIPADSLWPIGTAWLYHSARGQFYNLTYFDRAMEQRLGSPMNLRDYLRKAHFLGYEGERAMFEAFEVNRFRATGIIQWMYNAAWPKLWWQLFDYYLMPTSAFYGVKKACEPVHIAYNYGRKDVDLINNTLRPTSPLVADIQMVDLKGKTFYRRTVSLKPLSPQENRHLQVLDTISHTPQTYLLVLSVYNAQHEEISHNVYALSATPDLLDEAKSTWYVTPQSQYANLKALQDLPWVSLKVRSIWERRGNTTHVFVQVDNPTSQIAFMTYIDIQNATTHESIAPVFWKDNDITLLPGEKRIIEGWIYTKDLRGAKPEIAVSGWNVRDVMTP
ncbi:MAG: hypothetical protein K6T34_10115 [Thermoflavifilum sp.]|nr:hypothetical protein [Thermoflavifilum sp.]